MEKLYSIMDKNDIAANEKGEKEKEGVVSDVIQ